MGHAAGTLTILTGETESETKSGNFIDNLSVQSPDELDVEGYYIEVSNDGVNFVIPDGATFEGPEDSIVEFTTFPYAHWRVGSTGAATEDRVFSYSA